MAEEERDQDVTICPKMPWCASFQPHKKLEQISKYLVELILNIFFLQIKKMILYLSAELVFTSYILLTTDLLPCFNRKYLQISWTSQNFEIDTDLWVK